MKKTIKKRLLLVLGNLILTLGFSFGSSVSCDRSKINEKWEWSGWWPVTFVMYGILLYYSVVIAWCLSYVFFSINLSWGADPNSFFNNQYLQLSSGPFEIGNIRLPIIFSLLAVWFLSWFIVYFGVQNGVERANKIFMPLLFFLILVLVGWSLTLHGAMDGIRVYLTPNMSALYDWQIWVDAFSQIFFTLSLGFGIMIAYASYLPRKVDVVKDSLIICIGNSLFSFIAGFAVFGTLGYMAATSGKEVEEVVTQAIGLAFVTYPQAISQLPLFSSLFGVIFFLALVIAGISSAISIIEALTAALIDKFGLTRQKVVTFVCATGFMGSIIFTAQSGLLWLDIVDHYINNYGLVMMGFIECVLVAWMFKAEKLREHIDKSSQKRLIHLWDLSVKYIIPAVLLILLINSLKIEFSAPYGNYPLLALLLIGVNWLVLTFLFALFISLKSWKTPVKDVKLN